MKRHIGLAASLGLALGIGALFGHAMWGDATRRDRLLQEGECLLHRARGVPCVTSNTIVVSRSVGLDIRPDLDGPANSLYWKPEPRRSVTGPGPVHGTGTDDLEGFTEDVLEGFTEDVEEPPECMVIGLGADARVVCP